MLGYLNAFNLIKLNIIKRSKFGYIDISKKTTIIIKLLMKYDIIIGYSYITINNKKLFKVYFNTKFKCNNLKNLCKLTNQRTLKLRHLIKLSNKNTESKYIFCTSKGLIELKEAINYKVGGILLFKIA